MKAVQADTLESIQSYRIVDLPTPAPGEDEVRIRIAACGVGYVDALVSLGRYQVKPPLPHIPGGEVSGIVDQVGAGVTRLAVGDRVLAKTTGGGFAEQTMVKQAEAWRIPDRMSLAQAAGFRGNYLTALHALADRARLLDGETLLVIGAAGGVGLAAVQVGRALGARVIGVASTEEKRAAALKAGAHAVLDREPDGWRDRLKAIAPDGVDIVYDPVCGPLFQLAFRSLRWGGRHLVIGFTGGDIPALPANLPLLKGAGLLGVDVRQFSVTFEPEAARAAIGRLLGWVEDGVIEPPIGRLFPFASYAEALEFAMSGQGVGKTLLTVDDSLR